MLINLRNALMAGKRFPYDAEVEYLESTGTQWIDTGVKGNASASLIIECTFLQKQHSGTVGFVFGSRSATDERFGFAVIPGGVGGNYTFGYRYDHVYNVALSSNFETVRFVATPTVAECTFRGTTLTASNAPLDTNLNIYIFTRNFSGRTGQNFEGCLASLKIYSNGVLVRDYIPVRKGTVGYLYDRVSGKLFGNAGTGDFVVGQDVVPVEYIESHGAEYIDTGMYPTNNATTIVDAQLTRVSVAGATCHIHIVDSKESWNSRARTIGYWSGGSGSTSRIAVAYGSAGPAPASYAAATDYTTARMIYKIARNVFSVGSIYAHTFAAETFTSGLSMKVLANAAVSVSATAAKLYGWQHYEGDVLLQHCVPIRVGTEGAMMDTLTRRIYRNAGTGAFGYGNDLKYPIPAS